MYRLIMVAIVMAATATAAKAADLVLYGAGSLREAMTQIATSFGQAHGLSVTTQFGPSGRMRERIENGEHVDVSPPPMSAMPASWSRTAGPA